MFKNIWEAPVSKKDTLEICNIVIGDFNEQRNYIEHCEVYRDDDKQKYALVIVHWEDQYVTLDCYDNVLDLARDCFEYLDSIEYYHESAAQDPQGVENRIRDEICYNLYGEIF